jgi:tetratricopeptide (TPR) repeat protein
MPKPNCQFNGTGGQYVGTVLIHLIILTLLTFGLYWPWAWVKFLKLKASHTTMHGKSVSFEGSGGQLFALLFVQGLLTLITVGIYAPWAYCKYYQWRLQNTLVGGKAGQFSGTGGSLFFFYFIHLMILPMLTLGIYAFYGLYRLYAWKEERSRYGGEKTSFGAKFGGLMKVSLAAYFLNIITLNLFTPWAMCMFSKWQVNGLLVGREDEVEHFPPVRTNYAVAGVLLVIGLSPIAAMGLFIRGQMANIKMVQSQMAQMQTAPLLQNQHMMKAVPGPQPGLAQRSPAKAAPAEGKDSGPPPVAGAKDSAEVDYQFELKRLDSLLEINPKNADAFYNRGWLYAYKGEERAALNDYSKAIEIDANHADAHYNRGLIFVGLKDYEKAIEDFSAAIRLKPQSADAYCNRGAAYFEQGRLDLARQDYGEALKIDADDADVYFNRAAVYQAMGEKPKALADLQKAALLGHEKARQQLNMPQGGETQSAIAMKKPSAGWTMELNQARIPDGMAAGRICGNDFTVEKAKVENGILSLRQGQDFFPDREFMIFLFPEQGEALEGKTYRVAKDQGHGSPHVHMKWKPTNKDVPDAEIFMKEYTMLLEFGKQKNGVLPGKIYLSIPDESKSFVAGAFKADVN